jgi:hypothetical protein
MALFPLGILSAGAGSGFTKVASYEIIQSSILTTTESGITFSGLDTFSSEYKHLQIRWTGRTNRAAVTDNLSVRFNSDTGSNYNQHQLLNIASSSNTSQTRIPFNDGLLGASASANNFGGGYIDILEYSSTAKHKTIKAAHGVYNSGATIVSFVSGAWRSTSAITSVTLNLTTGSSFVSGSRFSIYGIKG